MGNCVVVELFMSKKKYVRIFDVMAPTLAPISSTPIKTRVTNAKFEMEKFNDTNNFGMWKCEVLDVLCQQELNRVLEGKPEDMDEKDWVKLNRQACSSIRLCLLKYQKYFVMKEISKEVLENVGE